METETKEMQEFVVEKNRQKKESTPCFSCKNASFLRYKKSDESSPIWAQKEVEEFDQELVKIQCKHWREFVVKPHLISECDGFSAT